MTEQEIFDAEMYKEFEQYCLTKRITDLAQTVEIYPVWTAAYRAGAQNMMLSQRHNGENGI